MGNWTELYQALRQRYLHKLSVATNPDDCLRIAKLLVIIEKTNHKATKHECTYEEEARDRRSREPTVPGSQP